MCTDISEVVNKENGFVIIDLNALKEHLKWVEFDNEYQATLLLLEEVEIDELSKHVGFRIIFVDLLHKAQLCEECMKMLNLSTDKEQKALVLKRAQQLSHPGNGTVVSIT